MSEGQRAFTDRTIQGLGSKARRYEMHDHGKGSVPGLAVRVSPSGSKVFVMIGRFPGSDYRVRRTLGAYPILGLADAREKAREWAKALALGTDPKEEVKKRRQEEITKRDHTFGSVAEAYFQFNKRDALRRSAELERDIRRQFGDPAYESDNKAPRKLSLWNRPIADVEWE